MLKFQCVRRSGEWTGSDEIFWGVSAGSDTTAKKSFKTREYGSVNTREFHQFDYDYNAGETYVFVGTVDQHLSTEFQCWEADDSNGGFYNDLRSALSTFADGAADTSMEMTRSGSSQQKNAAWAALLSLGARLLDWLLSVFTNDDDLVCERTIGFDRNALIRLRDMGGNYYNFDGGDGGYHHLYLASNDLN
jgi:hypothetical protein